MVVPKVDSSAVALVDHLASLMVVLLVDLTVERWAAVRVVKSVEPMADYLAGDLVDLSVWTSFQMNS